MKSTDVGYINKKIRKISDTEVFLKPMLVQKVMKWNALIVVISTLQMVVIFG